MNPSSDLRARVLAAARKEPSPPRQTVRRRAAAILILGFAPVLAFFQLGLGGVKVAERPVGFVVATGLAWLVLAAGATWGSLGRGGSMLGRPRAWLLATALATPVLLLVAHLIFVLIWPATLHVDCGTRTHLSCFHFTALMAIAPLAAFALVRKGTDPVHPRATGLSLGAAAGAWGAGAMGLHCPVTAPLHVFLAHVGPVILFALVGAWLGGRVVAVR